MAPIRGPSGETVDVLRGSFLTNRTVIVTGTAQDIVGLTPASFGGTRLGNISDEYRLFRFVSLELSAMRVADANNGVATIAYTPGIVAATPTALSEIVQFEHVVSARFGQTIPVTLRLGRRELAGISPWYETEAAAGDPLLDTQGQLLFAADGGSGLSVAGTLAVFGRYTIELDGRLPAAESLRRRARRLGLPLPELPVAPVGDDGVDATAAPGGPQQNVAPVLVMSKGLKPSAVGTDLMPRRISSCRFSRL